MIETFADHRLIIPYGSARVRPAMLAALADGRLEELSAPGAPVAVIDPAERRPLRMHAPEHPFTRPPVPQDLAHGTAQLAFLEAHLVGLCGDWAKPRRAFIAAYFAAVRATLREHREALLERLGPLAGLCELEHWGFSALMPLPAAHIPVAWHAVRGNSATGEDATETGGAAIAGADATEVGDATAGGDAAEAQAAPRAADFVEVDAAFWTGDTLVAVIVAAGGTPRPARLRELRRLEATGIPLMHLDMAALDPGDDTALLTTLGPPFADFWQGEPLPRSPFRGRGLGTPIPAVSDRR